MAKSTKTTRSEKSEKSQAKKSIAAASSIAAGRRASASRKGATPPHAPPDPPQAPRRVEFSLVLAGNDVGAEWAAVRLPEKVHAALGGDKARIPLAGTADGFPFRTSATPMEGHHWFVFNRAMREATGKTAGDRVKFCVWRDLEPRVIETPDDLRRALRGHKAVADFFEKMSFSHRKEIIAWIDDAKRAETRARRVTQATAKLAQAHAERLAKEATQKVRSGEASAQAKKAAGEAARVAKGLAKDAAGFAVAAASSAAYEYEDKLHKSAVRAATAIELGAASAARALRGIVQARKDRRKGGGI
ncbi:MAG: YdeI/OmpD-associated family protein [Phycisphaerales bacterium]